MPRSFVLASLLTLRRIDPDGRSVEPVLRLRGSGRHAHRAGAGAVRLADPDAGTLTRVDVSGRDRVVSTPLGRSGEPTAIALEAERAWVIANDRGQLAVVTADTGRVLRRVDVAEGGLADVEAAFGSVWVATGDAGTVVRIVPDSPNRPEEPSGLTRPGGFEPPTRGLQGRRGLLAPKSTVHKAGFCTGRDRSLRRKPFRPPQLGHRRLRRFHRSAV
jgi:hypothetical protein